MVAFGGDGGVDELVEGVGAEEVEVEGEGMGGGDGGLGIGGWGEVGPVEGEAGDVALFDLEPEGVAVDGGFEVAVAGDGDDEGGEADEADGEGEGGPGEEEGGTGEEEGEEEGGEADGCEGVALLFVVVELALYPAGVATEG